MRRADRAGAVASGAGLQARDGQLLDRAAHRFPKADLDLIFEVGAGLAFLDARLTAAAAEKLAEKIAKTGAALAAKIESAKIEVRARHRRAVEAAPRALGVEAELVVHLALLGVGKNVVGFLNLLEFFFGGFIARIQVGMIFARELAVGLANFFLRGLAGDAQQSRNNPVWLWSPLLPGSSRCRQRRRRYRNIYSLAQREFHCASSPCSLSRVLATSAALFLETSAHRCFFLVGALDLAIDPGRFVLDAIGVGAKAQQMTANVHGARREFRQLAPAAPHRTTASNRRRGSPTAAPARDRNSRAASEPLRGGPARLIPSAIGTLLVATAFTSPIRLSGLVRFLRFVDVHVLGVDDIAFAALRPGAAGSGPSAVRSARSA